MNNKLKFTVFFVAVLGMISCSKSDEDGQTPDEPRTSKIVGTWKMSAFSFDGSDTFEFNGKTYTDIYYGFGKGMNQVLLAFDGYGNVTPNGSFILDRTLKSGFGDVHSGNVPVEMETFVKIGTWEESGSILILTDDYKNVTEFTIEELNTTTLRLNGQLDGLLIGLGGVMNVDMQFTRF